MKILQIVTILIGIFSYNNIYCQNTVYPYSFNSKYGLVSSDNEKIIEPIYDKIGIFLNQDFNDFGVFMMRNIEDEPMYGLIDKFGDIIIEAKFKFLKYRGNGKFVIALEDSDTLKIIDIQSGEKVGQFKLGDYKIHNQIVVYKARDSEKATIIFGSKKEMEFNSKYSLEYKIYNEKKACPFVEIKGKYYNCNGEEVSSDDVFGSISLYEDQAIENANAYNRSRKTPLDPKIVSQFSSHRSIKPIYNNAGILQSLILDKNTLVNKEGGILYQNESYCPILTKYPDPFNRYNGLISCGYTNEQGLLNSKGKIILKREFVRIVSYQQYAKRLPNIDYEPEDLPNALMVLHKSGYGGLATQNGNLFLPKECDCIGN